MVAVWPTIQNCCEIYLAQMLTAYITLVLTFSFSEHFVSDQVKSTVNLNADGHLISTLPERVLDAPDYIDDYCKKYFS